MQGTEPAPWYLDSNGRMQGPYSNREIMALVTNGTLKADSRIFDSTANSWKTAAEVIPYLDVSPSRPSQEKAWQPPARPPEYRDVHVVDLNLDRTGSVDYFALIDERRKEVARNQTLVQKSQSQEALPRRGTTANTATKPEAPALRHSITHKPAASFRSETPRVRRVHPEVAQDTSPTLVETAIPVGSMNLTEAEPTSSSRSSAKILHWVRKSVAHVRENKKGYAVAASAALVFAGSFGVIRSFSDRASREPARAQNPGAVDPGAAPRAPQVDARRHQLPGTPPNGEGIESRREDSREGLRGRSNEELGMGRNRVRRERGGVSPTNSVRMSNMIPGMPVTSPSNESPSRDEPPREPAQFYSSAEDSAANAPAAQPTEAQSQPTPVAPQNQDPNQGVVRAPGFIPPGLPDPNADPSAQNP